MAKLYKLPVRKEPKLCTPRYIVVEDGQPKATAVPFDSHAKALKWMRAQPEGTLYNVFSVEYNFVGSATVGRHE